jgi:hypothetical protein
MGQHRISNAQEGTTGKSNMNSYEDHLKHIFDDTLWLQRSRRLFKSKFEPRIGVTLATNNKPQYSNFALNCKDVERLRKGKGAGTVELIYVVAMKTNGAGRLEYCGHREAEALYENIRNRQTINGINGPFWSLELDDFDDEDAPL